MPRLAAIGLALALPVLASADPAEFSFASIDGGTLALSAFEGQPMLVVNTASRCGFTDQLGGLQRLHERYGPEGLVVLAVPSDDFRQELGSAAEVKEFCETQFGLTLPMTDITPVTGAMAHPFYAWLRETTGFEPAWNFNKVLLSRDGTVLGTFGSATRPLSRRMTGAIEDALSPPA